MTGPAPMDPEASQEAEQLFALRDRLVRDVKQSKKGKATTVEGEAAASPLDHAAAFSLVLEILSAPPAVIATASKGSGIPSTTLVAFEVLEHLLRRAQAIVTSGAFPAENDSLRSQLSTPFLLSLSNNLYTAWDIQPLSVQAKLKSAIVILLALSSPSSLDVPEVSNQLKAKILADPWNNKRSLYSFEALLPHHEVEEFSAFSASTDLEVQEGVVQTIVDGILSSEDSAPIAGRVGISWIDKCWERQRRDGIKDQTFWTRPVLAACRLPGGSKGRQNLSTYFVTGICTKRKEAFKELITAGGYLFKDGDARVDKLSDEDLEAALAILRVGNNLNLVQLESTSVPADSPKLALPIALLETTSYRASASLRADTLSLLVLSPSPSTLIPLASFPLLKDFYTYSLGDEDGDFRMQTISLTGKLLLRLRDSAWKAQRTANKGKDGAVEAQEYVDTVKGWLNWWLNLVGKENLNPARPFRLKMNSLRMLDLAFQARIDPKYRIDGDRPVEATGKGKETGSEKRDATTGYSTYRKTASTQTPMFNTKHRPHNNKEGSSFSAEESAWPFDIAVVTPETTQILLRQFLSTYTALRSVCISTLERFPSPLPGYEGIEGTEKAKRDLLVPALRMIRSGREADASAGAGVVGLVWRKWVLESLEKKDESFAKWTLGEIGGWKESEGTRSGPPGFRFISSLLDLAEHELSVYATNLAHAASTIPMHGTLLALRHLFISIPSTSYETLSTPEERRALFHRALDVVKRVWEVTSPVLAAKGLEEAAKEDEADTEDARALRIGREAAAAMDTAEDDGDFVEADGTGGPQYKIIMNACWRAVKEASELLETLLRLPSELGTESFRSVWGYSEICGISDLFADWLRRIRHRGAAMALHPCYARAAGALLVAGRDWPEVGKLPEQWLDFHLDSIVSSRISFTRRSAAIPYLLVGLLTTILPSSRSSFENGFSRLFEIAESTSSDIPDESRVHAMNTLRTAFLDSKCGGIVGPFVERAFLLSISLFWSTNWVLRNVAMILFASLVTRAFNARRTNLDRDFVSLGKRLTIDDFFGRYPTLRVVLRDELERGWKQSLNEAPTSSLQSSIFAILMLLSLLQTPDPVDTPGVNATTSLADSFIPLVNACASSSVWKIRDAAGDALTGLVAPAQIPAHCEAILLDLERNLKTTSVNELHGRIGQVLRLLRSVPPLIDDAERRVAVAYDRLASVLLPAVPSSEDAPLRPTQPFAVYSPFLLISLYLPSSLNNPSSPVVAFSATSLAQAGRWTNSAYHLPSAEEYLRSCWQVLFKAATSEEQRLDLIRTALSGRSLEVKREALIQLESIVETNTNAVEGAQEELLALVVDEAQGPDVRVSAVEILRERPVASVPGELVGTLTALYERTSSIPLREGLIPILASIAEDDAERDVVLKMIERWSRAEESGESREASALALVSLRRTFDKTALPSSLESRFDLCLLRLLQDDDPTVRTYAAEAARLTLIEGKAVETVLIRGGDELARLIVEDEEIEFKHDVNTISNPSSLLFTVEKPNIYRDEHLVPALLLERGSLASSEAARSFFASTTSQRLASLAPVIASGRGVESGPLGREGNESVCKWAMPLVSRWDAIDSPQDPSLSATVDLLRPSA